MIKVFIQRSYDDGIPPEYLNMTEEGLEGAIEKEEKKIESEK
jgi:hypothetical protein